MASVLTQNRLRGYLEETRRNLYALRRDLDCAPFRKKARTELVIAVDWSEVYAYVMGTTSDAGSLSKVVSDPRLVEAAHQVALSVLFDRIGHSLLLLPPYESEMKQFVRQCHTEAMSDQIERTDRKQVLAEIRRSPDLKKLLARAQRARRDGVLDGDWFSETLKGTDHLRLLEWVEKHFSSLFLLARVAESNVLDGLGHLLGRGNVEKATLLNFEDYPEPLMSGPDPDYVDYERWVTLLRDAYPTKSPGPRVNDARALEYLSILGPALHDRSKQLMFVTRGYDMTVVARDSLSSFVCLSDAYLSRYQTSHTPTIMRSWSYFFELGLVWDPRSPKTTQRRIQERQLQVAGQLEALRANRRASKALRDNIAENVSKSIQNLKTFVAAEKPWLPHQPRKVENLAARFFVQYVTSPVHFSAERQSTRERVLDDLKKLVRNLNLDYPKAFVEDVLRDNLGITCTAVRDLSIEEWLSDVKSPWARRDLKSLYGTMQRRSAPVQRVVKSVVGRARDSGEGLFEDEELLRVTLTAFYACGAMDRVDGFADSAPGPSSEEVMTPSWLMWNFMLADGHYARGFRENANSVMRQTWKAAQESGQIGARPQMALVLLRAWLLVHLDWTENHGENIENLPSAPRGEGTELEWILREAEDLMDSVGRLPRGLTGSLANNCLYARARLTAIADGASGRMRRPPTLTVLDDRCEQHKRRLSRSGQGAERDDTLGYFYLKLGLRKGTRANYYYRLARERLDTARKGSANLPRVRALVNSHMRLLDAAEGPGLGLVWRRP